MTAARWLAGAVLLAVFVGTTGCGIGDLSKQSETDRCRWMSSPTPAAGRTVILVDASNSTRGSAAGNPETGGPAPHYRQAFQKVVQDAVGRRDAVSVASFSGTSRDLAWVVTGRSTDWQRDVGNEHNQQRRRSDAVDCLTREATPAIGATPLAAGTDVLQAIRFGAGAIDRGSRGGHLVILTDGLSTAGCADLTAIDRWTDAEITAIGERCARKKSLQPGDLSRIDLSIIGVGHSGPGYPMSPDARTDWLTTLWKTLCVRGTARSCRVEDQPVSGTGSTPAPSPTVDDPVVALAGRVRVYPVPGAALFDGDSATLRRDGEAELTRIARSIRAADWVQVNGYAAPHGEPGFLQRLSQGRAERVGDFLRGHEVPVVSSRGLGVTRSCPDAALSQRLSPDECSRRVDIVVGTS
ncbi:hypothetical protein [Cryptosporangium minutisporangium]|uniref:OmpA-like domain-containing protein n=1 Tax=Cryptosporangium minutisporangium TaxID=113569 RepID=A0ABP6SUH4_9ACTN